MKIKRSMSVRSSPLDDDRAGRIPKYPASYDPRWDVDGRWHGPWGYVVARVTNSTDFRPGFHMTRDQVDDLIAQGWTVTVMSNV